MHKAYLKSREILILKRELEILQVGNVNVGSLQGTSLKRIHQLNSRQHFAFPLNISFKELT